MSDNSGIPHFNSLDTNIATIDENGKITGISEGLTKIKVTYNNNQYSLDINVIEPIIFSSIENASPIQISNEEMQQDMKILQNKITFKYDIKLFTLYAFINYTGYDEDNYSQFGPVRKAVRQDLQNMNLQLSEPNYYKDKKISYSVYIQEMSTISGPPTFQFSGMNVNSKIPALNDLPDKLKEFYAKADIQNLYNKYKPYYDNIISEYKTIILHDIIRTCKYLEIDINTIQPTCIEPNLLEAYDRGVANTDLDETGIKVITFGNLYTEANRHDTMVGNLITINHEFLHTIINPITDKYSYDISKLQYLTNKIDKHSQAYTYASGGIYNVIVDCIVRSLACIPFDQSSKEVKGYLSYTQYNAGFFMLPHFYDNFIKFNECDKPLDQFIRDLINNYKE